jgi:tetratricopeptide (TPR) repeat protein
MRMETLTLCISLAITASGAIAQVVAPPGPMSSRCVQVHRTVNAQAENGRIFEAEATLSAALGTGIDLPQDACTGLLLSDMAAFVSVSGRDAEAEKFAERSIAILDRFYAPDDRVFLRPLRIVLAAQLEQYELARAKRTFGRIRSIRTERPEDRAIVHGIGATLLHVEGRHSEAQSEYLAAVRDWEEAGLGGTADAGAALGSLACLYMEERQFDQALKAVDRALAITDHARSAAGMDRVKLLNFRGVLHSRRGEWQEAERDLREAISAADREPSLEPRILWPILNNYAHVLRKNHRGREARGIQARAAAVRDRGQTAIVDVTELLANPAANRK